MGVPSLDVAA
jgi:hypothetical protein